jgi:hypothetical protein
MKKSPYDKCSTGEEFAQAAIKSARKRNCKSFPVEIQQTGSHLQIRTPKGRETIARHRWEFPLYLRRRITASLIAIGLVISLVIIF